MHCQKFHRQHPDYIVVDVSSCGAHPSATVQEPPYANGTSSSLGCFFADGFLSHVLGDGAALDIAPLFQFGELITSVHVKTALDLALFHAVRTGVMCHATEGNTVAVNLTRCGMYSNLMFIGMNQINPGMGVAIDKMSFDAYVTNDGQWVQLLGVDYKTHVPRVFKALGIGFGGTISTFLSSLPAVSTPMELIPVMFHDITAKIRRKMTTMTFADVAACFDHHDVWYTTVASPEQAVENEQARVTGAFRWKKGTHKDDATLLVNSPCQMTVWTQDTFEYGVPDSVQMEYE